MAEAVRNAATGYAVIVLGVVCFLLTLAVVIAGVRIFMGASLASNAATTAQTTAMTSTDEGGTT